MTKEYQTVILAALLHDIGKLLQKGSFGATLNPRKGILRLREEDIRVKSFKYVTQLGVVASYKM